MAFTVDETLYIRQKCDEFFVMPLFKRQIIGLKPVPQPAPRIAFAGLCQQFPVMLYFHSARKWHQLYWPEKHFTEAANYMA